MGDLGPCEFCSRSIDLPQEIVTIPNNESFSLNPTSLSGSGTGKRSLEHLWSYLYHQNVREYLLPRGDSTTSCDVMPKLTFTFSMGSRTTSGGGNGGAPNLQICEQCSEEFEKLNRLHTELQGVKKAIEEQVMNINRIRQSGGTHPLPMAAFPPAVEMSMTGSTIGKENISQALRFLAQLCDGILSPTATKPEGEEAVPPLAVPTPSHPLAPLSTVEPQIQLESLVEVVEPGSVPEAVQDEESVPFISGIESIDEEYGTTFIKIDSAEEPENLTNEAYDHVLIPPEGASNSPPISSTGNLFLDYRFSEESSVEVEEEEAEQDPLADDFIGTLLTIPVPSEGLSVSRSNVRKGKRVRRNRNRGRYSNQKQNCEICGKTLVNSDSLKNHMRTHTGERPFGCEFCGKRFAHRATLISHQLLHTGNRPFKCFKCKSTFPEKKYLTRHKKKSKCFGGGE